MKVKAGLFIVMVVSTMGSYAENAHCPDPDTITIVTSDVITIADPSGMTYRGDINLAGYSPGDVVNFVKVGVEMITATTGLPICFYMIGQQSVQLISQEKVMPVGNNWGVDAGYFSCSESVDLCLYQQVAS